ncbi:hypothetical protein N7474_005039 [Penicillium riverlandense]|uniref:uncharacterized protein n=1 Tax=Penicillium riverlandense TaxID=1903569 RepID=UPI0025493A73|nr:uncharacterized protein N7474_005039 [Penicillium riverlandense]KAJ5819448.1 hypothetical protein N7474_005039 [Penicillium riverlandense]
MASRKDLSGIFVAIHTPFTDDGSEIDSQRLQQHIDRLLASGVHGIIPGGSTGEFTALSIDERKRLTELCIKHVEGRVPVVVGTGALNTAECIDLAKHAAAAGAASLMIVPPFYDVLSFGQLQSLLFDIHTASGLQLMYYNNPAASGLTLTPSQMAKLSESGCKYVKDTAGDGPCLTELIFEKQDEIIIFNGCDTLTLYGFAAGAKGAVWATANLIPELAVQLWDVVAVKHDLVAGRALWAKIFPICKFLEAHNVSAAIKTGLELLGYKNGSVRKPFSMLGEDEKKELAGLLKAAGLKVVA